MTKGGGGPPLGPFCAPYTAIELLEPGRASPSRGMEGLRPLPWPPPRSVPAGRARGQRAGPPKGREPRPGGSAGDAKYPILSWAGEALRQVTGPEPGRHGQDGLEASRDDRGAEVEGAGVGRGKLRAGQGWAEGSELAGMGRGKLRAGQGRAEGSEPGRDGQGWAGEGSQQGWDGQKARSSAHGQGRARSWAGMGRGPGAGQIQSVLSRGVAVSGEEEVGNKPGMKQPRLEGFH